MSGGPMDGDLIASCQQPTADLDGGDGEALSWTDAVRSDLLDGRSGVCKDNVPMATLLSSVHDALRLRAHEYGDRSTL